MARKWTLADVCRRCVVALSSLVVVACTHTVIPPRAAEDPVAAFLLDHGRHASLVLPREQGMIRYSYGHWSYYAMNRTGLLRASGTLVGASGGALGRKRLSGSADLESVKRRVLVPVEAGWPIEVASKRARELGRRLDRLFREQAATRIYNPLYDLEFVRHPEPYHVGHNSNHVTGEWLRALGCRVRMRGPFSTWRVEGAAPSEPVTSAPGSVAGRDRSGRARFAGDRVGGGR